MTRARRGVSLIEMAVAIAIIASSLLVALTVLPRTYGSLRQSQERMLATYLGQRVLDDYKSMPFGTLQQTFGMPTSTAPTTPQDYAAAAQSITQFCLINGNPSHVSFTWQTVATWPWAPPRGDTSPNAKLIKLVTTVRWVSNAGGSNTIARSTLLESVTRREK